MTPLIACEPNDLVELLLKEIQIALKKDMVL